MSVFATKPLSEQPDYLAPDGSEVRLLVEGSHGGMAHFRLDPGHTSTAVAHKSVEEIWFFLSGEGEFWRKSKDAEEIISVRHNMSIRIPPRTGFQFRSLGPEPLEAVAVTMPPWPGAEEAEAVSGKWPATISGESSE
jgi:mannose-6-phosphate isomerase-like protein (cupin superfamily)